MICVEQAIILSTDAAKARARARSYMKTYVPRLPNYLNNLKNLGMGRRRIRERLQRQTGRCDRGVGNRETDPGSHPGASEGGSDAGVHSAVTSRQPNGSPSEGGLY